MPSLHATTPPLRRRGIGARPPTSSIRDRPLLARVLEIPLPAVAIPRGQRTVQVTEPLTNRVDSLDLKSISTWAQRHRADSADRTVFLCGSDQSFPLALGAERRANFHTVTPERVQVLSLSTHLM